MSPMASLVTASSVRSVATALLRITAGPVCRPTSTPLVPATSLVSSESLMSRRPRKRKPLNDSPARWKRIQSTYGLSRDQYHSILEEQGGSCFICRRTPESIRPRRHLAVDHDHSTGRIRGLLCYACNHRLLGYMIKDDVQKAQRLVQYLTRKTNYGTVPS